MKRRPDGTYLKIHGMRYSKEYKTWDAMKERCLNKNNKQYPYYGGRGIRICDRWLSFENFYKDMGNRPAGLTIDRIDNDGNYEPRNCRWADVKTQNLNRRTICFVTFRGKTKCLKHWASELGFRQGCLQKRVQSGWPIEKAFTKPSRSKVGREFQAEAARRYFSK